MLFQLEFKGPEAATGSVLQKKVFLEISQSSQENTCARVSLLIKLQACNFVKKETLAQVFTCEFCEIFKSTFFTEHLWTTASEGPYHNIRMRLGNALVLYDLYGLFLHSGFFSVKKG